MSKYNRRYRKKRTDFGHVQLTIILLLMLVIKLHYVRKLPSFLIGLLFVLALLAWVVYFIEKPKKVIRNATLSKMDGMSGEDFEHAILFYLKKLGWHVTDTSVTGDFGADLVGLDPQGIQCVIQAKRWNNNVGVAAVHEVLGAKAYYRAERAIVVTNRYLTKSARELAKRANVETWERGKLASIIKFQQRGSDLNMSSSIGTSGNDK